MLLNHHFLLLQQLIPAIAATTVFLQWRHRTNKSIGERQTRDNKGNRGRKPEREKNKKSTQEGNKHGGQKSWENRKKKKTERQRGRHKELNIKEQKKGSRTEEKPNAGSGIPASPQNSSKELGKRLRTEAPAPGMRSCFPLLSF